MLFFFQAEDGIRDHCVTGVQTCALPILYRPVLMVWTCVAASGNTSPNHKHRAIYPGPVTSYNQRALIAKNATPSSQLARRSEERRVGKEWRKSGRQAQLKENMEGDTDCV